MASISQQKNGRRIIQFVGRDGKRRSIRLGKISQRNAEGIKIKIEALNSCLISGQPIDGDTSKWVSSLDDVMSKKLSNVGLIAERNSSTLMQFIDGYIDSKTDIGDSSKLVLGHTRRNLVEYFGADKPLRDITEGDADLWRLYLINQPLAECTVRRKCGFAKQFFRAAMRLGLIANNPFIDLKSSIQADHSKFFFVTRDNAEKILNACPDAEWRLIFAL